MANTSPVMDREGSGNPCIGSLLVVEAWSSIAADPTATSRHQVYTRTGSRAGSAGWKPCVGLTESRPEPMPSDDLLWVCRSVGFAIDGMPRVHVSSHGSTQQGNDRDAEQGD